MGMDYCYAGSASYGRFSEELNTVVELFGAIRDEHTVTKTVAFEITEDVTYRYKFPKGTPEAFYRWANDPYGDFDHEQTKTIYNFMLPKWKEVKKISPQIADELECCIGDSSYWSIH